MFKISVITVSFNSAATIRDSIESVLAQDYSNLEYIVVDGGSTDDTLKILDRYRDRISRVISEPDQGIYDAMNKGIAAATGDFVGMLNSDDFYIDRRSISKLVRRLEESGADCAYADLVVVKRTDINRTIRYYDSSRFLPNRLRYGWMPAHPTLFVARRLYERLGGYSLDYEIAADYEMVVRLFHTVGCSYVYLPEVLVKMRSGGISTKDFRSRWLLNKEIVRACRANGLPTSMPRVLLKVPLKLMEFSWFRYLRLRSSY